MENVLLQKVKVVVSDNNMSIDAYYELDGKEFRVHEEVFSSDVEPFTVLNERARVWENSGKLIIYFDDSGHSDVYSFLLEKSVMSLFVPTDFLQKEIEAIIYSLETD